MSFDPSSLEADLCELKASALDDAFLSRLEAAADGTVTQLTREEVQFENLLRGTQPSALSPEFLTTLEGIASKALFSKNENVVPFPARKNPAPAVRSRPIWGAAAAVALIGAATALLMPIAKQPEQTVSQISPLMPSMPGSSSKTLVPASFDRDLSGVREEGIVWKTNKQPHSVVRVAYDEKITLKDEAGEIYQVVQPRVQYMLVPAKTD